MTNFFRTKAKIIYLLYFIAIFLILILALGYLTNFKDIVVFHRVDTLGNLIITQGTPNSDATRYNTALFTRFANNELGLPDGMVSDFETYKMVVFNFRNALNSFNDLLIVFLCISLVCIAALFVVSNHSRRIYYKSNLIVGIVAPLVVIIFSIVLMVINFGLMSDFTENYDLFNIVSVLQNEVTQTSASQSTIEEIKEMYSCNNLTFILATVVFIFTIIYSLLLIIYAIFRYKDSAEERKEIISKAVLSND